jgi:hypothetical protein
MTSIISPFEYVTVLVAIILGMGITKVVSGLTSLVQHSERVKIYWPHLVLIILIFILHIQEWWDTYNLLNYKWRLPVFLFIILYPVNLYVLARIVFPPSFRTKVIDLKEFYYDNFRRVYLFIAISAVLAIIDNVFVTGIPLKDQIVQLFVFSSSLLFVITKNKNEMLHKAMALFLLSIAIGAFVVTWNIYIL